MWKTKPVRISQHELKVPHRSFRMMEKPQIQLLLRQYVQHRTDAGHKLAFSFTQLWVISCKLELAKAIKTPLSFAPLSWWTTACASGFWKMNGEQIFFTPTFFVQDMFLPDTTWWSNIFINSYIALLFGTWQQLLEHKAKWGCSISERESSLKVRSWFSSN